MNMCLELCTAWFISYQNLDDSHDNTKVIVSWHGVYVCVYVHPQGNAGIGLSILTVLMSVAIVLIVALSAVGVCERCRVESGGIYFLMAHILGSRIGGSVGVIYCFAQVCTWLLYFPGCSCTFYSFCTEFGGFGVSGKSISCSFLQRASCLLTVTV